LNLRARMENEIALTNGGVPDPEPLVLSAACCATVNTLEGVAVACIMGVFMAGVNLAFELSLRQAKTFVRDLGVILLHGLGLG